MYEQCMKIQITMESQAKADWKAVISNFQKAWVIWFPSRGNISTGINLWMVLDNLNKSYSVQSPLYAQHVMWTFWSPAIWSPSRIHRVDGKILSHLTEARVDEQIKHPHNLEHFEEAYLPIDSLWTLLIHTNFSSLWIWWEMAESLKCTPPLVTSLYALTL